MYGSGSGSVSASDQGVSPRAGGSTPRLRGALRRKAAAGANAAGQLEAAATAAAAAAPVAQPPQRYGWGRTGSARLAAWPGGSSPARRSGGAVVACITVRVFACVRVCVSSSVWLVSLV